MLNLRVCKHGVCCGFEIELKLELGREFSMG